MRKNPIKLTTTSLDEQGFALAKKDGKVYKIVGALGNEEVCASVYRKKQKTLYAEAIEIIKKHPARISPSSIEYKANSPFQILQYEHELEFKKELIAKYFKEFANTTLKPEIYTNNQTTNYRNKMEYSFYKDEEGLFYALSLRGSFKRKLKIKNSILAKDKLNRISEDFLNLLNSSNLPKQKLITIRQAKQDVFAKLYTTNPDELNLEQILEHAKKSGFKSFSVELSNPKTPAAVSQKTLARYGEFILKESVLGKEFVFDFEHFFQVNIPIFEQALLDTKEYLSKQKNKYKKLIDLFSGVGVIGIVLQEFANEIYSVEISSNILEFAKTNAQINSVANLQASQSDARDIGVFDGKGTLLVVDPPRSGMGEKLVKKIINSLPQTIIYLSCNPKTQAQDYNLLKQHYEIEFAKAYNFFPLTTHIENLLILKKR